ncbi:DUF3898 domain-containing protein, partial [Bacillus sp. WP8]|uniref:DUF3898 domain-containing protein n=1 Tax=Bacillus sp. WP8 TaxID=756828 RepID=UPI0011A5F958
EIRERLDREQVREGGSDIVEESGDMRMKMGVGEREMKGVVGEFGEWMDIGKVKNGYVVVVEGDEMVFEKGRRGVEFDKANGSKEVVSELREKGYDSDVE